MGRAVATRRQLRRAFGAEAVNYIQDQNKALHAIAGILLGRGLFGRLKWLLLGK